MAGLSQDCSRKNDLMKRARVAYAARNVDTAESGKPRAILGKSHAAPVLNCRILQLTT